VTSLASVCLGKHVESIVKVLTLVDFVTSNDGNHINDGQTRGHTVSQKVCVCVCVCEREREEKPA